MGRVAGNGLTDSLPHTYVYIDACVYTYIHIHHICNMIYAYDWGSSLLPLAAIASTSGDTHKSKSVMQIGC